MADSLEYWGFGADCGRAAGRSKFVSLRFGSVCTEYETNFRPTRCSNAF